jgi:AcrR family transcriptional regulator
LEDALLDAAWQQLEQDGYAGFTLEAVAERAGTSRPVLYRRWAGKDELVGAAIVHELGRDRVTVPDTGSLREDTLELLRRASETRGRLVPVLSVLIGSYFSATGTTFADVQERAFGGRARTAMDEIIERAVARGEIDPGRVSPRVRTVAIDLMRHHMFLTFKPLSEADIIGIVDEIFLPLVRTTGNLDGPGASTTT